MTEILSLLFLAGLFTAIYFVVKAHREYKEYLRQEQYWRAKEASVIKAAEKEGGK